MPIDIRPLTPADHDALNRVALETHAHHVDGAPDVFRMPDFMFEPGFISEISDQPDEFLRGAFDGSQMVGYLWAHLREVQADPQQHDRRWITVRMIGVNASHRGQGIGQLLMAAAESWARDLGVTIVTLGVWAFNTRAIRFYERLGYTPFIINLRKSLEED